LVAIDWRSMICAIALRTAMLSTGFFLTLNVM
jgi:hypothetical protein